MGFVPSGPTEMQLVALENYLSADMFTEPDNVLFELLNEDYGEHYDIDDFIEYDGLDEYCSSKKNVKIR